MENEPFNIEQKEYLKGFFAGVSQRSEALAFVGETPSGHITADETLSVTGNLAEEKVHGFDLDELCKEELIKHEEHGLDVWNKILDHASKDRFPEGGDVFRWKFHGLFYVKPAQDSLMLRCRIPGCILKDYQMDGLARIAEIWGGNYAHITTRGNIQIREIAAKNSVNVLLDLADIGLTSRGSGADNIRNITASPTSGFDAGEIIDVLPLAKAMHHYILNNREMYDLPRKFNISFDNGGAISVCADTNDIAFYAVRAQLPEDAGQEPYFRMQLCGITGHKQFAIDTGLLLKPSESIAVAAAVLRVFRRHGDRTNRKKARLKYLVDDWGLTRFLDETQRELGFELRHYPLEKCTQRESVTKLGYIGVYAQKQQGLSYIGVSVPVGRLEPHQMRGLSRIAREYGEGELRLTVWQNLLIPHISDAELDSAKAEIKQLGLSTEYHPITAGLVSCTGNRGCKYSSTDTKGHAVALGKHLKNRVDLDQPINIHFTGCPHSCAQHYIGDIGLLGTKVKRGENTLEGYNIVLGGGTDDQQNIAQEVFSQIPNEELPDLLEQILKIYLNKRSGTESFAHFTRRHTAQQLRDFVQLSANFA